MKTIFFRQGRVSLGGHLPCLREVMSATAGTGCGKGKREMGKDVLEARDSGTMQDVPRLLFWSNSEQGSQTPHSQASLAPALRLTASLMVVAWAEWPWWNRSEGRGSSVESSP